MSPSLLVTELWGLGDLVVGVPFLKAASEQYAVTLLAKPYAEEVCRAFGVEVQVVPWVAPWTAFRGKYRIHGWPIRELFALQQELRRQAFDFGVSARWDPRDHALLWLAGARVRIGFPRRGSAVLLSQPLERPGQHAHRYEYWKEIGKALGLHLPASGLSSPDLDSKSGFILVHTGAAQPLRVWPLDRYRSLVQRLRAAGFIVKVAADSQQQSFWRSAGETDLAVPASVGELVDLARQARLFIGNDSGPGHVAAMAGVRTFTIFGPQLPESFAPLHRKAAWIEGRPCPYKPCFDNCRFPEPNCIIGVTESTVWLQLESLLSELSGR